MKIVILGGGSAGWMTASALIKAFPSYEIVVVDKEDGSPIGVGESTINGIRNFCNFLGIDERDFLKQTDGSYKLAIQFKDFEYIGSEPFLYPFGSPDIYGTSMGLQDWLLKKYSYPDTPITDFAESFFPAALMVKHNVFFKDVPDESLTTYNSDVGIAYHFDAIKFAQWLQNNYAVPRGVKHLKEEFGYAVRGENETIQYFVTKNGGKIDADLFVDCSGFSSLLLGASLEEEFISYADLLPNSSAIATQLPYKNKVKELTPTTTCTAIENGWVWNIPLWSRIGTGYVYSPEFISDDQALEEFVRYLMSEHREFPRNVEDVKNLTFKKIKFKTGIYKRTWVGNVVAIGLSAGFIEPLESSGLYTVHEFLFQLIRALSKGNPTQWDKDAYNTSTYNLFNEFAEFVALHYALSKRTDTQYWEKLSRKSYVNLSKKEPSVFESLIKAKTVTSLIPQTGGYPYILVGMNYLPLDDISAFIGEKEKKVDYSKEYRDLISYITSRKSYWDSIISKQTSLYTYLKNNVYFE